MLAAAGKDEVETRALTTERRKKPVEAPARFMDISSMSETVALLSKLLQFLDLIKIDEIQYCNITFQLHN